MSHVVAVVLCCVLILLVVLISSIAHLDSPLSQTRALVLDTFSSTMEAALADDPINAPPIVANWSKVRCLVSYD